MARQQLLCSWQLLWQQLAEAAERERERGRELLWQQLAEAQRARERERERER